MKENNVDHNHMAIELITTRGKSTPFLKLTFLTQSECKDATKKLTATITSHGYVISPVKPQEVQSWLANYKKAAKAKIVDILEEKGYHLSDSYI